MIVCRVHCLCTTTLAQVFSRFSKKAPRARDYSPFFGSSEKPRKKMDNTLFDPLPFAPILKEYPPTPAKRFKPTVSGFSNVTTDPTKHGMWKVQRSLKIGINKVNAYFGYYTDLDTAGRVATYVKYHDLKSLNELRESLNEQMAEHGAAQQSPVMAALAPPAAQPPPVACPSPIAVSVAHPGIGCKRPRDIVTELNELKQMKDNGDLTPEEFIAAKKKVLQE